MTQSHVGHMPSGLYLALFQIAHENRMSVAQLQFELVRWAIAEKFGWKCNHDDKDRKWSRKIRMFYCKNCYTFFEKKTVSYGKFEWVPLPPIWERLANKEMTATQWSAMIKPDQKIQEGLK